jgi:hypothetical protein
MSASKKTTSKKSLSPDAAAPATKSALARAVSKKNPAPTVQATTPSPVAMLAPSPVAAVTPAVKPAAKPSVPTTITAQVDVGFGNALFVRGEGAGLSWDQGLPMECIADDRWRVVLAESARAYTFKFLINDTTWSSGPDFTAACGTSVTLKPEFS